MVANVPWVSPHPDGGSNEFFEQLRGIYYDLAITPTAVNFAALMQITNTAQVVFGTDFPYAPEPARPIIADRVEEILRALPCDQRAAIECANALRLFPRLRALLSETKPA
jgi:hypothetical protein